MNDPNWEHGTSFRVNFDKKGDIISVEVDIDGEMHKVKDPKSFPIKAGDIKHMKNISILFGEVDPCVQQGNVLYCW